MNFVSIQKFMESAAYNRITDFHACLKKKRAKEAEENRRRMTSGQTLPHIKTQSVSKGVLCLNPAWKLRGNVVRHLEDPFDALTVLLRKTNSKT